MKIMSNSASGKTKKNHNKIRLFIAAISSTILSTSRHTFSGWQVTFLLWCSAALVLLLGECAVEVNYQRSDEKMMMKMNVPTTHSLTYQGSGLSTGLPRRRSCPYPINRFIWCPALGERCSGQGCQYLSILVVMIPAANAHVNMANIMAMNVYPTIIASSFTNWLQY